MTQQLIYLNESRQPAFIRANKHILEKYKQEFAALPNSKARSNRLKELWYKEYSATIIGDWEAVSFDDTKKYTYYLLRWG